MNLPLSQFGAIARPSDARDKYLGSASAPVAIPSRYKPDISNVPVKSQEQYPTCGAHAGAALMSILATKADNYVEDLSPKYLWRRIKQIDGYPLEAGTDMRSIFKALQGQGVCTEALSPDTIDPTLEQYSDPKQITPPMTVSGGYYKIDSYGFIDNPTMAQIKQAIFQYSAVIALVDIGDGWWANGRSEAATCPLRLGNKVGRHFVTLYGYDETYIYGRNSFDRDWGDVGDLYFDQSYVPHVVEIGTPLPNLSIRQKAIAALKAQVAVLTASLLKLRPA